MQHSPGCSSIKYIHALSCWKEAEIQAGLYQKYSSSVPRRWLNDPTERFLHQTQGRNKVPVWEDDMSVMEEGFSMCLLARSHLHSELSLSEQSTRQGAGAILYKSWEHPWLSWTKLWAKAAVEIMNGGSTATRSSLRMKVAKISFFEVKLMIKNTQQ